MYISTIDLKFAFGQIRPHRNTLKHSVAAKSEGRHHRLKEGLYGLTDMPVVFQGKFDRVLENTAKDCKHDTICATSGSPDEHGVELEKVLEKLEQRGYRESMEKLKLL